MRTIDDGLYYDPETEVLSIDGLRFSREIFRNLARWDIGTHLELFNREDGVISVKRHEQ